MKYALLLAVLFLAGCGDVNFTTTASGGNSTDPVIVPAEVVVVD